jgi:hypothetical protein
LTDTDKARRFLAGDRFAALTGIEIVEAGKGYCKTRMVIEGRHLNAAKVILGGAIFTPGRSGFGRGFEQPWSVGFGDQCQHLFFIQQIDGYPLCHRN